MSYQSWVGRTIANRYKLETLLGAGGMSAVYRAYDPNLRRAVAVKLIHPHLSENPNFVYRFKEEAAAVASLRHPNIVLVHDFNNEGDTYYMVMEYLAGETLQARLRRVNAAGRHLPLNEAIRISLQICDAAGYAHRHDLIHRDIKPANIMLDLQGQAILMDFGIVKIVGGQYHTVTGATIGTAIYMSPEQIRGERVDERSDIYSMGVLLFEMLSGRPPYEADSALTLMMMHLNDPIPNPSDLRPDVPPLLAAVVIKALAKDREQRYQSAAEMAAGLRKVEPLLASLPVDAPTVAATVAPPGEVAPPAVEPLPTQLDDNLTRPTSEAAGAPPPPGEAAPSPAPTQLPEEPAPATILEELESVQVESPPPAGQVLESAETEIAPLQTAPQVTVLESSLVEDQPSPAIREAPVPRRRPRWLGLVIGLALFIVLALVAVWFINQRRPPTLQLMPIERPSVTINLDSQAQMVSLGQWKVDSVCQKLAFSPDLDRLGSACNREQVRFSPYRHYASLWLVRPGELQTHLLDHTAWMFSLDFSPDGAWLATSAEDGLIDIWQVRDGVITRTIEPEEGAVYSLDFSPNGELLAGALGNGAGLWQVSNGHLLRTYPSEDQGLTAVAFSPGGEYLAGGSDTGQVFIWRVSDSALLYKLPGHEAQIYQLAFSPDGRQLASASSDNTLNLWKVEDGSLLAKLEGHEDGVTGVVFSPDGSLLISTSWDGSMRLWNAADGSPLRTIQTDDSLLSLAISPDGAWLATASSNGSLQFWGVSESLSLMPVSPRIHQ